MRGFFVFLILIGAGFTAGYMAAKGNVIELILARVKPPEEITPTQFQPTEFALENQAFCIVIVGRNNGAYLEKTIQSALSQNYENFRIVYVDDGSDDGSQDLAKEKLQEEGVKTSFICNAERLGLNGSLSRALENSPDEEIVVLLHGEDWLAHEWVLKRLNQYYADPDLWLTFGKSRDYPGYSISPTKLLSFYASLFKGEVEAVFDKALGHSEELTDILYICNNETDIKTF